MSPSGEDSDLDQTRDRSSSESGVAFGSHARLEALVGRPRHAASTRGAGTDGVRLAALVSSASANTSPLTAPAMAAPAYDETSDPKAQRPRGHRRVDWLNTTVAAVAVAAALGTAVFAGAHMANASPAADAVQVLTTEEATLAGTESALATSKSRLEERIQTADADVALVRTALSTMAETEEQPATAEPAALATAIESVDTYRAALAEIELPDVPAPYERGPVDEESLASVGEAIDQIQVKSADVNAVVEELRSSRASFDALTDTYSTQLATFSDAFESDAAVELEANPAAGDEFRSAVTDAARAVATTPLDGAGGATALMTYHDAVIALRAEDLRVRIEEEAARDSQSENQNWNNQWWTDQPETPTDPGTTDPGTTDPGTTDPGTTDPGTTPPGDETETPAG